MLGNGFLPMFAPGGAANVWTGATWATSGGNAYNVPTLGSELLTDGGLENWTTATNLTSWTEIATGGSTVNQESSVVQAGTYAARIDIDGANAIAYIRQATTTVIGRWLALGAFLRASAAGKTVRMDLAGTNQATGQTLALTTAYQLYNHSSRAVSTLVTLDIIRAAMAAASYYVDSVSIKVVVPATLFATIAGASSNQTAAAKITTLTTGTQSGVVALLDSGGNPQNFLIAYHNGTSVLLDKCVAGTYTNLITTTVAFTANAQIEIRRPSGNTFQLWYNGVQRGTDQTVSDAGIISNTLYGLFSTHSGGTFSEFSLGGVVIPFNLPGA
jgi:hypothetical protein